MASLNEPQQGEENVLHEILPREEYQETKHKGNIPQRSQQQLDESQQKQKHQQQQSAPVKENFVKEIPHTPNSAVSASAQPRQPAFSGEIDHDSHQQDKSPQSPSYVSGEGAMPASSSSSSYRFRRQQRDGGDGGNRYHYGENQYRQPPIGTPRNHGSSKEDYSRYSSSTPSSYHRRYSSSQEYSRQHPIAPQQQQQYEGAYSSSRRESYGSSSSRPSGDQYHSRYSSRHHSSQSPPPRYSSSRRDDPPSHHYPPDRGAALSPPHPRQQRPPITRYWFMLAFNEGDIELSQEQNLWATKKRLCNYLNDQLALGGKNILIFGVFGKLYVAGYGIMTTPVGASEANKTYPWLDTHSSRDKNFGVKWLSKTYVHYDVVNKAYRLGDIHDATEIDPQHAEEIIKIIDENAGGNTTSLEEPAPPAVPASSMHPTPRTVPTSAHAASYQQAMSAHQAPHHISPRHAHGNAPHSSYYSPPLSPPRKRQRYSPHSPGYEPEPSNHPHFYHHQQREHYDDYAHNSYKRRRYEYDEGGNKDKGLPPKPDYIPPPHHHHPDSYGARSTSGYDKYGYDKKSSYDKSYREHSPLPPPMEKEHRYANRYDDRRDEDHHGASYRQERQSWRDDHYQPRKPLEGQEPSSSSSYHATPPSYYQQAPHSRGSYLNNNNSNSSSSSNNDSNHSSYHAPRNGPSYRSYPGNDSRKPSPYHNRR